jgi:hypothetical protein
LNRILGRQNKNIRRNTATEEKPTNLRDLDSDVNVENGTGKAAKLERADNIDFGGGADGE